MDAFQHEVGSRDRIVAAARHLFSAQGFHQAPMSELAALAQVSVGQMYRLFKSKNDIICAIAEDDAEERFGAIASVNEQVKANALTIEAGLTQVVLLALSEDDEALFFEIVAEAHRNPTVGGTIAGLCDRYRRIMRDLAAMANPGLSEADLDAGEELLLACIFGLGLRKISAPRLSVEETAIQTARMIVAALRALGPGSAPGQRVSPRLLAVSPPR
jgi:TetR/AcrR family transcriptional repressor of uid operon